MRPLRRRNCPEYLLLPPEDYPLPPENAALPPEEAPTGKPRHLPFRPGARRGSLSPVPRDSSAAARERKLRSSAKLCLVAAALTVTTVLSLTPPVEASPDSPAAAYMEQYPVAFYSESPEESERMLEDELWRKVFFGLPDLGYVAPFADTFPGQAEFRSALRVESALQPGGSDILGYSYYPFSLTLPDGEFHGRVYLLPDEHCAILRAMNNGSAEYYYIGESETVLNIPYDVTEGRADITAFGNGADIVGFWDTDSPETFVRFHITSEHTLDCGRSSIGLLVNLFNTKEQP